MAAEFLTFDELIKIWSDVTGRAGVHVKCSSGDFIKVWGRFGEELAVQFEFLEVFTDWDGLYNTVSKEELGIGEGVRGHREALESLKEHL